MMSPQATANTNKATAKLRNQTVIQQLAAMQHLEHEEICRNLAEGPPNRCVRALVRSCVRACVCSCICVRMRSCIHAFLRSDECSCAVSILVRRSKMALPQKTEHFHFHFSPTVLFSEGKHVWKWICGFGRKVKISACSRTVRLNCLHIGA